jgi:Leucine-rich repeat (LRR) protein
LDLNDFVDLEKLDCSFNRLTTLNLSNCSKLRWIKCDNNQLVELKVDNLNNLTELCCSNNQLINLDIGNCNQLKELRCSNNCLEILKLTYQTEQLTYLHINNNNFPEQDLSMFSHLVNLKQLHLGN